MLDSKKDITLSWEIPNEEFWTKKGGLREVAPIALEIERDEVIKQTPNYVLIDAALWGEDIYVAKQLCGNFRSLFRGKVGEELNSVAPFLFEVEPCGEFDDWINKKNQKEQTSRRITWINASCSIDDLRKHLRRFLKVSKETGGMMYFRLYDPWVLYYVLPCLTAIQINELFLQIKYLVTSKDVFNEMRYFYISRYTKELQVTIIQY